MKNRILSTVSFLVVAAALVAPSVASAQLDTRCRPDDLLCADVRISKIEDHLRIGPGDAPPPPVVVETPPPPAVVVQTPPPPPVVVQTPPTVVIEGPPPPQQVVVVAPPPREPTVVAV